jgi:hypothetical protein
MPTTLRHPSLAWRLPLIMKPKFSQEKIRIWAVMPKHFRLSLPDWTYILPSDVLWRPDEDRRGREGSRVAIGQTRAGRSLRVIYVLDPEPESLYVITAYELRGKPLTAYRRRQRRKGQR